MDKVARILQDFLYLSIDLLPIIQRNNVHYSQGTGLCKIGSNETCDQTNQAYERREELDSSSSRLELFQRFLMA